MKIRGFEAFDLRNALGICGCGIPGEAYEKVHEMLVRARDRKDLITAQGDSLLTGYQYFMAYTLDDHELISHGYCIDNAWITEKGLAMIEFIELIRPHDYEYAELPNGEPWFEGEVIS